MPTPSTFLLYRANGWLKNSTFKARHLRPTRPSCSGSFLFCSFWLAFFFRFPFYFSNPSQPRAPRFRFCFNSHDTPVRETTAACLCSEQLLLSFLRRRGGGCSFVFHRFVLLSERALRVKMFASFAVLKDFDSRYDYVTIRTALCPRSLRAFLVFGVVLRRYFLFYASSGRGSRRIYARI